MCGCCPPPEAPRGRHPALDPKPKPDLMPPSFFPAPEPVTTGRYCFVNCGLPGDQCACYRASRLGAEFAAAFESLGRAS